MGEGVQSHSLKSLWIRHCFSLHYDVFGPVIVAFPGHTVILIYK